MLVTDVGESLTIEDAPGAFVLNASSTPWSPDLGRDRPQRAMDYYSDGEPAVSVSVGERLFAGPATDLRSEDGAVYVQGGNVFRFMGEGRFTATGYTSISGAGQGVAVYSGHCNKR